MISWPLVSVVFVTYKRLECLRDTYASFIATCSYPNLELIVSDDGSPKAVQDEIRNMRFDQYLLSKNNEGMGANTNKGMLAASGDFILHLQDDWHCQGPADFIEAGVELMKECDDVCMVQYWRDWESFPYPSRYHSTRDGLKARILLDYPGMVASRKGFHIYSDCPHLKRATMIKTVGLYSESNRPVLAPLAANLGLDLQQSSIEVDYCHRFEQHGNLHAAILESYGAVFKHTGSNQTFNWNQKKANLRKRLEEHPLLRSVWHKYLHARYGRQA
jgi:glycosyltransferase involved in cell wall biosynthesis